MQFTWNEKFTKMFEKLQGEDVTIMLAAVCQYGTYGTEPEDLPYPLDAMFESVRDDIDFSHSKRNAGGKGGASSKKQKAQAADSAEDRAQKASSTTATNESASSQQKGAESATSTLPDADSASSKNEVDESASSCFEISDSASTQYKAIHSNTLQGNTKEKDKKKSPAQAPDPIPYGEIVGYLNAKTGRNFSPDAKSARRCIKARWGEGYRVEDFKTVVDGKAAEWLGDPKMANYVRPDTLFSEKFDGYLNTAPLAARAKQHTGVLGGSHAPDYSREGW